MLKIGGFLLYISFSYFWILLAYYHHCLLYLDAGGGISVHLNIIILYGNLLARLFGSFCYPHLCCFPILQTSHFIYFSNLVCKVAPSTIYIYISTNSLLCINAIYIAFITI